VISNLKTYRLILNDYLVVKEVKMRNKRYINVSIPEGLADAIDDFIENNPKFDLRSRAQVVTFALRKLFIEERKK